jgi:transcriptional regulator with XRE-family HTH domain
MLIHRIKEIREHNGWSQEYVAKKLDISQSYYCKIESGAEELRVSLLEKIIAVLDININDLFADKKVAAVTIQECDNNFTAYIQHIDNTNKELLAQNQKNIEQITAQHGQSLERLFGLFADLVKQVSSTKS